MIDVYEDIFQWKRIFNVFTEKDIDAFKALWNKIHTYRCKEYNLRKNNWLDQEKRRSHYVIWLYCLLALYM